MPRGTTYLEWRWANDGLNYLVPAEGLSRERTFQDDDGFTNDLGACVGNSTASSELRLCAQHRMITERAGMGRIDEASAELTYGKNRALNEDWSLRSTAGIGAVATGPLGGAPVQDAFHRLIRWGRTLSGEQQGFLQDSYAGGVKLGPRLRVGLHASRRLPHGLQAILGGELVVNPGVGASGGQVDLGLRREWTLGSGGLRIFGQVAGRRLRAEETRATFRGAYPRDAAFLQSFAGLAYFGGFGEVGFGLSLNVEGNGAHQGVLHFRKNL